MVLEVRGLSHRLLGAMGTLFPAKQTRQYRFGGRALLPAPCLLSVPHPVQHGHPHLLRGQGWIEPKSGRLEGTNGHSFSFFYFSLISSFVLLVSIQPPDSIMTYTHNFSLLLGILLL